MAAAMSASDGATTSASTADQIAFQYVVLRCVPRVDREEFLNVGVVLFAPDVDFLRAAWRLNQARLHALDPSLDLGRVREALTWVDQICDGRANAELSVGVRATAYGTRQAADGPGQRFGLLKAPRSTTIQPSPVHGGVTTDPAAQLRLLLDSYVS
ncbi:MAG: DUF3037 domain-containing protein [Nocardioides sp.]